MYDRALPFVSAEKSRIVAGLPVHGQPFQGAAALPLPIVHVGALFELGEGPAGGVRVPVYLPKAHALAALVLMLHEAGHILRGIAQEQADLVGELLRSRSRSMRQATQRDGVSVQ